MESISKNVILDLLPVYIAGEASEETRKLVENYAESDPEIQQMIQSGNLDFGEISSNVNPPDDLEMKTIKHVRRSIRRQMWLVAIATASILLIPLTAMFFTNEVNWSLSDFIVMGILLSGSGLLYVFISRLSENIAYRVGTAIAVATGLLLIWVNLAVGIIGSSDNPANLMYFGVIAVGVIGTILTRAKANGMKVTMMLTALSQSIIAAISLFGKLGTKMIQPAEILMLNGFFIALFLSAAFLFHLADDRKETKKAVH